MYKLKFFVVNNHLTDVVWFAIYGSAKDSILMIHASRSKYTEGVACIQHNAR